jgi:hypothetical protein
MLTVLMSFLRTARLSMRSRATLQLEILALRHQLQILQRSRRRRVHLTQADRLLVGLAVPGLDAVALRSRHREARDRSSPGTVAPSGSCGLGRVVAVSVD